MKLKLVTLTFAALAATTARAQSAPTFTLYGIADVGAAAQNSGYGWHPAVMSSGGLSSRLGIKGDMQLVEGLSAVYLAEAGMGWNTGVVANGAAVNGINNTAASSGAFNGPGPQFFSRQVYAGLRSSSYGQLTVGRHYSATYLMAAGTAVPNPGLYGYSVAITGVNGMPVRVNNSAVYVSPKVAGAYLYAMGSTGQNNNTNDLDDVADSSVTAYAAKTNARAGRIGDAGIFYSQGPLNAAVSGWYGYANNYNSTAGETALAIKKGWLAAVNYDVLGLTRIYGSATQAFITGGHYENVTKTRSKTLGLGVATLTPIGNHRIGLNYTNFNDKSFQDRDAELFGVMYWYLITPKTRVYASYGYLRNHGSSTYSLADAGNLVANVATFNGIGADARGAMVGFSQEF